jgi:hypothetical protein
MEDKFSEVRRTKILQSVLATFSARMVCGGKAKPPSAVKREK